MIKLAYWHIQPESKNELYSIYLLKIWPLRNQKSLKKRIRKYLTIEYQQDNLQSAARQRDVAGIIKSIW